MPRNEAHTVAGALMKAQHKKLPDGTGAGHGWILAGQLLKANWVMDQNEQWKKQHQWKK